MATMAMTMTTPAPATQLKIKREGDISDAFASLSGYKEQSLPDEFRQLKLHLSNGNETALTASWNRLLDELKAENEVVAQTGPAIIPEVRFSHLADDIATALPEIKKRGVVVVRGVIPEEEARGYKSEVEEYIRKNQPKTKGFPANDPQVWELYWSAPQLRARTHPNFLQVQRELMQSTWHISNPDSLISLSQPMTYADRLRIRQPGDAAFALGPHQDGGSVERWMTEGYGRGGTYDAIFRGQWDTEYDPWDGSTRVNAVNDLFNGLGACTAFRMYQGWLSMSEVGPREGTLLVNPLVKLSTVYTLLRPFFRPRSNITPSLSNGLPPVGSQERAKFLDKDNWEFTAGEAMTSEIQGATPGYGMEYPLKGALHPHLELDRTMVHVPRVKPGDFVAWHCDGKFGHPTSQLTSLLSFFSFFFFNPALVLVRKVWKGIPPSLSG